MKNPEKKLWEYINLAKELPDNEKHIVLRAFVDKYKEAIVEAHRLLGFDVEVDLTVRYKNGNKE